MNKSNSPRSVSAADREQIEQFRQDLETELDKAIDHHEFKMVYIGIATLAAFAGVIYLSIKYQLPFF